MVYPVEILPHPNYKLIDCDLSAHFVSRFFDVISGVDILDPETNKILIQHICSPRERIEDLSMSLLGIFKPEHVFLEFTSQGKAMYMDYCKPNADPKIPVFEDDFNLNKNRNYWWIPIGQIHEKEFEYTSNEKPNVATCFVCHTPMLWNYWHFSLRWTTEFGTLSNMDEKLKKKAAKRIAHSARVIISQYASISNPDLTPLDYTCYSTKKVD